MKIKTNKELESSGYRCLFEYVRQEGIERAIHLIHDINKISFAKNIMLKQTIVYGKNDFLSLIKRNLDIVKYLRAHEKDLRAFNFTSENVLNTLIRLSKDISLLELYLENAKILEELKVSTVRFLRFPLHDTYKCEIYRNDWGKIININKCYTDGQIESVEPEREVDKLYNCSEISFSIDNQNETQSFVLNANNNKNGYQYRSIEITDFGFDGSKLPPEDEIQSYEIPRCLIKK